MTTPADTLAPYFPTEPVPTLTLNRDSLADAAPKFDKAATGIIDTLRRRTPVDADGIAKFLQAEAGVALDVIRHVKAIEVAAGDVVDESRRAVEDADAQIDKIMKPRQIAEGRLDQLRQERDRLALLAEQPRSRVPAWVAAKAKVNADRLDVVVAQLAEDVQLADQALASLRQFRGIAAGVQRDAEDIAADASDTAEAASVSVDRVRRCSVELAQLAEESRLLVQNQQGGSRALRQAATQTETHLKAAARHMSAWADLA